MTETANLSSAQLADESTTPAALEFGLVVADIDTLVRFYRDALGCEIYGEYRGAGGVRLVSLSFGSSIFKLFRRDVLAQAPDARGIDVLGYQYISFKVTDIDVAWVAALRAGAEEVMAPKAVTPACTAAILRDPEGNMFELVEGAPWGFDSSERPSGES